MSELLYSSHRLSHSYFFLLLIIFSIYNNVLFSEPLWWIRLIYNNARMLLKLEWAFSFFSAMSIAESSKDPGYGEDPGLGSNSGTMMSQSSSTSFSRTNSHHSHASSSASNTSSKASSQHHGFNQQRTQLWILLQIVSFCFFFILLVPMNVKQILWRKYFLTGCGITGKCDAPPAQVVDSQTVSK